MSRCDLQLESPSHLVDKSVNEDRVHELDLDFDGGVNFGNIVLQVEGVDLVEDEPDLSREVETELHLFEEGPLQVNIEPL